MTKRSRNHQKLSTTIKNHKKRSLNGSRLHRPSKHHQNITKTPPKGDQPTRNQAANEPTGDPTGPTQHRQPMALKVPRAPHPATRQAPRARRRGTPDTAAQARPRNQPRPGPAGQASTDRQKQQGAANFAGKLQPTQDRPKSCSRHGRPPRARSKLCEKPGHPHWDLKPSKHHGVKTTKNHEMAKPL